jgi:hypothetical protein
MFDVRRLIFDVNAAIAVALQSRVDRKLRQGPSRRESGEAAERLA